MTAIELQGVTKRFDDTVALSDLDLAVRSGEVYGFLGPNGPGKTTTIDTLLDFSRPTAGEITVLGMDAGSESIAIRERTGVLPEGFDLYDRLTGRQHLEFSIESKVADDDPDELAERVGVPDALDRKVGGYSKGMTQRLGLASALVGEPDLLVLDEPSTGLDPNGAREMREIVREEAGCGATVFFSSHILGQVEAVCDRVGILRGGELVAEDSIDALRDALRTEETFRLHLDEPSEAIVGPVEALSGVSTVAMENSSLVVTCASDAKPEVFRTVEREGARVKDFSLSEASLDEVFATYTGEASA
ncbi:ABC transporter ATP-binding protein [Natronorarus salvus]|uniref:ABC transporter ATP-binding protein n=1 Tax=Natronorarus salvus TaxID=3117733 RepID=UPI002F26CB8D